MVVVSPSCRDSTHVCVLHRESSASPVNMPQGGPEARTDCVNQTQDELHSKQPAVRIVVVQR